MGLAGGDKEVMDARNSLVPSMDLDPVEHLWNLDSLQTVQGMNDAPVETTRTIESKHTPCQGCYTGKWRTGTD